MLGGMSDPIQVLPPIDVVAAVMRRGERWFLARRAPGSRHAGEWEFPGGKVDPGETPPEALRRELLEELGIDSRVGARLGTVAAAGATGPLRLIFHTVEPFGEPRAQGDHDACAWVTRQEALALPLAPADRAFVERQADA